MSLWWVIIQVREGKYPSYKYKDTSYARHPHDRVNKRSATQIGHELKTPVDFQKL